MQTSDSHRLLDRFLGMGLPWPMRLSWYVGLSSAWGLLLFWFASMWLPPASQRMIQSTAGQSETFTEAPEAVVLQPISSSAQPVGKTLTSIGFGELMATGLELDWQAAKEHCTAQGMRLPSVAALQALWQLQTHRRPSNAELCTQAGWPLAKLCGGSAGQAEYWSLGEQLDVPQTVNLFNGVARVRHANARMHLACSRDEGAAQ